MMADRIIRLLTMWLIASSSFAMFPPLATVPARLMPRQSSSIDDSISCSALSSLYNSCAAETPGFSTLNAQYQVSCLCYKSSTLVPTIYDKALETCISYYETADPALLTSTGIAQFFTLTAFNRTWTTPCAEYSAYVSVQSVQSDPRVSACYSWAAIVSSCNQATPGFTTLSLSSQASCACYLSGGSSWAPMVYDEYLDVCLDYYSTYNTQYYTEIHGDQLQRTPCIAAGNVRNGVTVTGAQASASIPTQTSSTASEILTTSEPQATAKPNQAPTRAASYAGLTLLSLFALPLILMLYL